MDIGDLAEVKGLCSVLAGGDFRSCQGNSACWPSPCPCREKHHGLKDTDLRYRQRYVDLIVNPEVKDTFVKRSGIIKTMRSFLDQQGFIEVENRILNTIRRGSQTRHHPSQHPGSGLVSALHGSLKRLIVGAWQKVYEIGRQFRNEHVCEA